jgi:SAM-dependent methyltransferase
LTVRRPVLGVRFTTKECLVNKFLIAAFHLLKQRRPGQSVELSLLTDNPDGCPRGECERMLSPWSVWASVRDYHVLRGPAGVSLLEGLKVSADHCFIGLADQPAVQDSLRRACAEVGAWFIEPVIPPPETLDVALLWEVSYFDFEYGGKNEWDGQPTQYARETLRLFSATHCKDYFPHFAFAGLGGRTGRGAGGRLKVMDVGCGPISVLRWGALNDLLTLTGVDPLLEMYAVVRARHGLDRLPHIRCGREIPAFAEELDTKDAENDYDVVYTQNALDHTQDPVRVIENIGRKLAPGGAAIIQVATCEGTRQNWKQLHKTDIFLQDQTLMHRHEDGAEMPLLSKASRLHLKTVHCSSPEWLACTLEKA